MSLTWQDSVAIAEALYDKYPNVDPLSIRFTDLYQWISELDEFTDQPEKANERYLEAILVAWLDEYN